MVCGVVGDRLKAPGRKPVELLGIYLDGRERDERIHVPIEPVEVEHERAAEHDRRGRDHMAHGQQFLLARLAARREVVDGAADVLQRQAHILACGLVISKLDVTVGPEVDFLDQALVNDYQIDTSVAFKRNTPPATPPTDA